MTARHPSASTPTISVSVDNAFSCEKPEEMSLEKLKQLGLRYGSIQIGFQAPNKGVEERSLPHFDIEQPSLQLYGLSGEKLIAVFMAEGEEELVKRQIPVEGTAFRPVIFDITPGTEDTRALIQSFLEGYLGQALEESSWASVQGLRTPAMFYSASLGSPNVPHAKEEVSGIRIGINLFSMGDIIQMKRLLLINTAQEAPQDA